MRAAGPTVCLRCDMLRIGRLWDRNRTSGMNFRTGRALFGRSLPVLLSEGGGGRGCRAQHFLDGAGDAVNAFSTFD